MIKHHRLLLGEVDTNLGQASTETGATSDIADLKTYYLFWT